MNRKLLPSEAYVTLAASPFVSFFTNCQIKMNIKKKQELPMTIKTEETMKVILFAIMASMLTGCVTYNLTGKVYMKRDRYGESPVVDLRDMASMYEWNYQRAKN